MGTVPKLTNLAGDSVTVAGKRVAEMTVRGIILGVLITFVFTAANVYIGLKVALTFATSIPAAVISMAVLSAFKNASILENNIVQTVASAAGTLSAIIFVLPGLVIVGWWTGFPFWTSFWICAAGGVLGVLFTIPLRRAMVTTSDLPYPEGVAAAEVLEIGNQNRSAAKGEARLGQTAMICGSLVSLGLAGAGYWLGLPFWICAAGGLLVVCFIVSLRYPMVLSSAVLPCPDDNAAADVPQADGRTRGGDVPAEAREGLIAVLWGSVGAVVLSILTATRIAAGEVTGFFKIGHSASGYDMSFSMALLGAGYLVGLSVGAAMLLGLAIAWAAAVPILTSVIPANGQDLASFVNSVWLHKVRFIGAGSIAVAAIWTLTKLAGPVVRGVISTMAASRRTEQTSDLTDTDLSPTWIGLLAGLCLIVICWLLLQFLSGTALAGDTFRLVAIALPFIFVGGFLVAAITGYMAGLIGASNSPLSGVGILAILICATLLLAVVQPPAEARSALVAFALFSTAVVFAIGTISNNNLQDLKTGQLVGATPRAQQWALIIGVMAGAFVIPLVLNLLNAADGFAGAAHLPHGTSAALAAPQANLISALAQGVIEQKIDWAMIGIGGALGVVLILLDEFMGWRKWLRLPPLAVGMGIYLPMSVTLPVVVGTVAGHWYDLWTERHTKAPEHAKRLGVLVASGMIVGESLFGVLLAGLIVSFNSAAPLALVAEDFWAGPAIGWAAFGLLILLLYRWKMQRAEAASPEKAPR
jgi:putative OPT family oligopeptide transporter